MSFWTGKYQLRAMLKLFSSLIVFSCLIGHAVAEDNLPADQLQTKTISLAIKYGMKAYLKNADFQQLKQKKMAELSRMPPQQFQAEYVQAWPVLRQCPAIVSQYRLRPVMAKNDVLKIIARLSLNDCLNAIDNIPDQVVVDQFNNCLHDPDFQDKSLLEQIDFIMAKYFGRES